MKWRVMVELTGSEGVVRSQEVSAGGSNASECLATTVGLTLADGKRTLAGLQDRLVRAQADEYCRQRRGRSHCGSQRPLKDVCTRRLLSLFGTLEVRAPRFLSCQCAATSWHTLTPVPKSCPIGAGPSTSMSSRRWGLCCRTPGPGDGHVRSVRSYQVRSFEVMLAQASSDDGKQVVFSSMPADADRQRDQLRGVLHGLGATSGTPVTVLSDGAEGPRSLGEAACVGPTRMCWTGSTCRRASSTLPRQP